MLHVIKWQGWWWNDKVIIFNVKSGVPLCPEEHWSPPLESHSRDTCYSDPWIFHLIHLRLVGSCLKKPLKSWKRIILSLSTQLHNHKNILFCWSTILRHAYTNVYNGRCNPILIYMYLQQLCLTFNISPHTHVYSNAIRKVSRTKYKHLEL